MVCAYELFVYLLWRNVYSDFLFIFNWIISISTIELYFLYSKYKSCIRLWILNDYSCFVAYLDSIICSTKISNYNEAQFYIFCFCYFVLLVSYLRNHCLTQSHKYLLLSFSLRSVASITLSFGWRGRLWSNATDTVYFNYDITDFLE